MEKANSLSIVIPIYNSETTIEKLVDALVGQFESEFDKLEIILVNDGSKDNSHQKAHSCFVKYPDVVKYVRLARNFSEHNAVMCGLHYVTCDCVSIIDDDFQNPPEEIQKLVDKLAEGYDVVYSYYQKKHHSFFRNIGSSFNNIVATLLLKKPKNLYLSSFKVFNKFMIDTILQYDGPYPYIDGLILRSTSAIGTQLCEHQQRDSGRSNYTLKRLVLLWLNMFTSFSVVPLRISSFLGFFMSGFGLFLAAFFFYSYSVGGVFFTQTVPPGWASLIIITTIFSGIQLSVLGMIGEYLGRIFLTINRQPQFVIREAFGTEDNKSENSDE